MFRAASDEAGEKAPLVNHNRRERDDQKARAQSMAASAAEGLKQGLTGWIRANKQVYVYVRARFFVGLIEVVQRKHALEVTVERCDNITKHNTEQFAMLQVIRSR